MYVRFFLGFMFIICVNVIPSVYNFISAGDLLQLGASAVFRFNNPQEAAKLRKRQSVSETFSLPLY